MKLTKESLYSFLVGTAIGDAFGAGVEFQDRNWIRENVDFTSFVNARDKINVPKEQLSAFVKNYHAWDYTDDTEMTIGSLKALFSQEEWTPDLLVEFWKKEYLEGESKKGFGRNGHGSMSWFYNGEKSIEEIRSFQKDRFNPGNAPAMRSAILAFVEFDKQLEYAKINAEATHPNPKAIESSQGVVVAADYIMFEKGSQKDVISYCLERLLFCDETIKLLQGVNELGAYESLKGDDFELLGGVQPIKAPYFLEGINGIPSDSQYTLGAVLYVLKHSNSPFEALKNAVNLGGDVDSIASICTAILAFRDGLSDLPDFMINKVEGREYFKKLSHQFLNRY